MLSLITTLSYLLAIFAVWLMIVWPYLLSIIYGWKKFECTRCGHCCRLLVRLYDDDIKRLGKSLTEDKIEKIKGVSYIKRKNGYCPFLSIKRGQAKCDVYKTRPKICSSYPRLRVLGIHAHDFRCRSFKK